MAAVGNLLAMTEQQPRGQKERKEREGTKVSRRRATAFFFLFFVTPGVHMAGVWEIILEAV